MFAKASSTLTLTLMMIVWANMFWFIQEQQKSENTVQILPTIPEYRLEMLNEQCTFQLKKNIIFQRVANDFKTTFLQKKQTDTEAQNIISSLDHIVLYQNTVSLQKECKNLIIPFEQMEIVINKTDSYLSPSFRNIEMVCNGSIQCMGSMLEITLEKKALDFISSKLNIPSLIVQTYFQTKVIHVIGKWNAVVEEALRSVMDTSSIYAMLYIKTKEQQTSVFDAILEFKSFIPLGVSALLTMVILLQVRWLNVEKDRCEKTFHSLQCDLGSKDRTIQQFKDQKAVDEGELSDTKSQLDTLKTEYDEKEQQLEDLKKQVVLTNDKVEELKKQKSQLDTKVTITEQDCNSLKEQIRNLTDEKKALEQQLDKTVKGLKEQLEHTNALNEKAIQEMKETVEDLKKQKSQLDTAVTITEQKCNSLKQIENLTDEKKALEQQLDNTKVSKVSAENTIKDVKEQLEHTNALNEKAIQEMKETVEDLKKQKSQLDTKVTITKQECNSLKEQIRILTDENKVLEDNAKSVANLLEYQRDTNKKLNDLIGQLEKKKTEDEKNIQKLSTEQAVLSEKLCSKKEESKKRVKELEDLRNKVEMMGREISELNISLNEKKECCRVNEELNGELKKMEAIEKESQQQKESNEMLSNEIAKLKLQNNDHQEQNDRMKLEVEQLNEKIEVLEKLLEEMKEKNETFTKAVEEAVGSIDGLGQVKNCQAMPVTEIKEKQADKEESEPSFQIETPSSLENEQELELSSDKKFFNEHNYDKLKTKIEKKKKDEGFTKPEENLKINKLPTDISPKELRELCKNLPKTIEECIAVRKAFSSMWGNLKPKKKSKTTKKVEVDPQQSKQLLTIYGQQKRDCQ